MQKIEHGEFRNVLAIFQSERQWLREIACARHYHICVESQSLRMLLKVCSMSCLYRSHREKNLTKNSGFEQKAGVNERTLRNHNCKPFAHTITNWLTLGAATIGEESIVKRFSFKIHSLSTFLWKFYAWLKLFFSASNFFSSIFGFCFISSFFFLSLMASQITNFIWNCWSLFDKRTAIKILLTSFDHIYEYFGLAVIVDNVRWSTDVR